MSMKCEERFFEIYGGEPEGLSFSPYRVCPIGAHVDHNLGKVTGFAIDKGIHIAYRAKKNGVVEMTSLQFPKRAQWHIASVPKEKQKAGRTILEVPLGLWENGIRCGWASAA